MLGNININRLLESAKRSDVRGYNIYTCGKKELHRPSQKLPVLQKWDAPSLGLSGMAAIGHELDKKDLIVPALSVNGTALELGVLRNRWTPAFMDTYYRCRPFGEYPKSGLIAVRERKCFTENDTFVSHLTVFNDGREAVTLRLTLTLPFEKISEGGYSVKAKITPRSLKPDTYLTGFAAASTDRGETVTVTVPPQGNVHIRYGFAFSPSSEASARQALTDALSCPDPFADAESRFNRWMAEHAPALRTDNADLLKIYYYRFFVIKSAIHTPSDVLPDSEFHAQCVYESPFGGWFGAPIGLPIPLQIEEMKWMRDVSALRSHIRNWCRKAGVTQGYIQFTPMAIWRLYLQTGDQTLVSDCYEAIKTYTLKKCKPDGIGLPITKGSWVTGAEYQPAFYQHTSPKWDWRHDTEGVKDGYSMTTLYRVDECVMHAANLTACQRMAELLGKADDVAAFSAHAARAVEQIRRVCWNEEKQFFFDADATTESPCDEAYEYDGFMPMMFSLFGKEYHSVFDRLAKEERFDSGFALTSVGKDCPMYWFDNCIAGPTASSLAEPHLYDCSWNGPVWPFAVSLVLDALGDASYSNESLTPTFKRLFEEYTELHFDFGDRSTPCICEHYRPTDGLSFSPYTEYFHSEWLNLFYSYYLGIRITDDGISCKPITDEEFVVDGIVVGGKTYRVSQENQNGTLSCQVQRIE